MYTEMKKCPDCGKLARMELHIDADGVPILECQSCGTVHEDRSWYRYVSSAEADEIIKTRKPLGLFVLDAGIEIVGIDNRTGDVWTEDFPNLRECLLWLSDLDRMED